MSLEDYFIIGGEPRKTEKWKYAIVIQGPFYASWTPTIIKLFLERNKSCLIIVSTYTENHDFSQEDRVVFVCIKTPDKNLYPDFWRTNHHNQNLQRLSSFIGIKYAKSLGITTVLKTRSDVILGRENLCEFLDEISEVPLILPQDYTLKFPMKKRIVAIDQTIRSCDGNHGKYFVGDKFFFGHVDDLLLFFDVRDGCVWNLGNGVSDNYNVETRFVECWMKILVSDQHLMNFLKLQRDFLASQIQSTSNMFI